eukprot:gb/GECH01009269.1/.p1 GENE.gb/GECH01009269.1/~~gb/GECH01009269.1/.p1  ORF type:complete len:557 (+),score=127.03 gb/GECH01009269.1/:1-1671(+)
MEHQLLARENFHCESCQYTQFKINEEGTRVCARCGEADNTIKEELEGGYFNGAAIKTRKIKVKQEDSTREELDSDESIMKILQTFLSIQTQHLITKFGFPSFLDSIIQEDIWPKYINLLNQARYPLKGEKSIPEAFKEVTLWHLIIILYIGCLKTRIPILLHELREWILRGDIPFFRISYNSIDVATNQRYHFQLGKKEVKKLFSSRIGERILPHTLDLYRSTIRLTSLLEIELPHLNTSHFTSKLISNLIFPNLFNKYTKRILRMVMMIHLSKTPSFQDIMSNRFQLCSNNDSLDDRKINTFDISQDLNEWMFFPFASNPIPLFRDFPPEVFFAVCLIIALRLCYGLDDQVQSPASNLFHDPSLPSWNNLVNSRHQAFKEKNLGIFWKDTELDFLDTAHKVREFSDRTKDWLFGDKSHAIPKATKLQIPTIQQSLNRLEQYESQFEIHSNISEEEEPKEEEEEQEIEVDMQTDDKTSLSNGHGKYLTYNFSTVNSKEEFNSDHVHSQVAYLIESISTILDVPEKIIFRRMVKTENQLIKSMKSKRKVVHRNYVKK